MSKLMTSAALALCLAACLSVRAKPAALFPAAVLAWPAVEADYERGMQDGLQDGDLSLAVFGQLDAEGVALEAALTTRSVEGVRAAPWASEMRAWAARGIQDKLDDGEIGFGVAASLSEQLENFSAVIARIQGI